MIWDLQHSSWLRWVSVLLYSAFMKGLPPPVDFNASSMSHRWLISELRRLRFTSIPKQHSAHISSSSSTFTFPHWHFVKSEVKLSSLMSWWCMAIARRAAELVDRCWRLFTFKSNARVSWKIRIIKLSELANNISDKPIVIMRENPTTIYVGRRQTCSRKSLNCGWTISHFSTTSLDLMQIPPKVSPLSSDHHHRRLSRVVSWSLTCVIFIFNSISMSLLVPDGELHLMCGLCEMITWWTEYRSSLTWARAYTHLRVLWVALRWH